LRYPRASQASAHLNRRAATPNAVTASDNNPKVEHASGTKVVVLVHVPGLKANSTMPDPVPVGRSCPESKAVMVFTVGPAKALGDFLAQG
jgi:hypothetical protein